MSFETKLEKILEKYESLNQKFLDASKLDREEFAELSREQSEIEPIALTIKKYHAKLSEEEELKNIINDSNTDLEFKNMASDDLQQNKEDIEKILYELRVMLLPKDVNDNKNVILEIRAGTGGDEAALFVAVLLKMYRRYCERHKWQFELLSTTETGLQGYKEVLASITGNGVFARLKFESGGHRVQRIPETETSGRIHTSAATVAILPAAEDVELHIDEKDLRIDVYRSSGAGGQHVNTTDSAVRITHIPTGISVQCQDGRSQHKNKDKAMQILRSRLYDMELAKKQSERSQTRKLQIGSGDRSERIRTYNYSQSRVTDHRINLTLHNLSEVVNDGALDPLIDRLITEDQSSKLSEINE
jgi:peptide chain release factor 1